MWLYKGRSITLIEVSVKSHLKKSLNNRFLYVNEPMLVLDLYKSDKKPSYSIENIKHYDHDGDSLDGGSSDTRHGEVRPESVHVVHSPKKDHSFQLDKHVPKGEKPTEEHANKLREYFHNCLKQYGKHKKNYSEKSRELDKKHGMKSGSLDLLPGFARTEKDYNSRVKRLVDRGKADDEHNKVTNGHSYHVGECLHQMAKDFNNHGELHVMFPKGEPWHHDSLYGVSNTIRGVVHKHAKKVRAAAQEGFSDKRNPHKYQDKGTYTQSSRDPKERNMHFGKTKETGSVEKKIKDAYNRPFVKYEPSKPPKKSTGDIPLEG